MPWFKKSFYIVFMIAIATMFSGCSTKKTTTETQAQVFTVWSFEDEDVWKPIVKEMQRELKGYEIRYIKKALSESYESDTLNSILSGQGPDIWAMPNDWIYRHKDKLAPMPAELIEQNQINIEEQFVPIIKQTAVFDNQIYALSPTVDTLMVYYNQKIFDAALDDFSEANKTSSRDSDEVRATKQAAQQRANNLLSQVPTNWTDFVEAVKLITKKDGNNISRSGAALGSVDTVNYSDHIIYALALQNGASMLSTDLKLATLNLPQDTAQGTDDYPTRRALEFFLSFGNSASANYSWNGSLGSSADAFAQGKTAMIIAPQSAGQYFAQRYPNFSFRNAPLPQIGLGDNIVGDYATYTAFTVPKLSPNYQAAWAFVYQLSIGQYGYDTTVRLSTSAKKRDFSPSVKDREGASNPANFQNQTAQNWVKGRYPKQVDNILLNSFRDAETGKLSPQATLDSATLKITDVLKKEDW